MTTFVPAMVVIVGVFGKSNRCMLQAQQIGVHLHGIKKSVASNRRLSTLIESFSLQLLHQPIRFHAKGFFTINYDPLRDVILGCTADG